MREERDELMAQTWPQLRRFCRERHLDLVEVDLRWGIAEEQSTRKETLRVCLDEIRACRPFFIGLLGERYGWVPGNDALTADLREEQSWLRHLRGKSITELEILHGVLNNPKMAGRAFFYFRDPSYATRRGADFLPEDPSSSVKQTALKAMIRKVAGKYGIPLREDYPDPSSLAALVLADLRMEIETHSPKQSIPDPVTRQQSDHEAFAGTHRRTHIVRPDDFQVLDRHAQSGDGPLVVLGASGVGKSALLASWIDHWRRDRPQDFVFQHYVGGTTDSVDHWRLMARLVTEIKRWSGDLEDVPTSHDLLLKAFPEWLAKARIRAERTGVRIILVVDGLGQLEDRDHARSLGWLPSHPFAGPLRLIVSALPGEALLALEARDWKSLNVAPLTLDERREMIEEYLARFGKKLDAPRLKRIADAPAGANPLYLKVLLDELRVTGTHERLDERLDDYLSANDIPLLLRKVLDRFQRDYERDRPGLVGETLGLLWAARRGLTEAELMSLLRPENLPQLPLATWAPLHAAIEESLVDCGGVLNLAHEFFRSAVEDEFVPDRERRDALRLRLIAEFEAQPVNARSSDELPWLLWQTENRDRLRACLLDIDRLLEIGDRGGAGELMRYWVWLGEERAMGKPYLASFEAWSSESNREDTGVASAATRLASFLSQADLNAEAEVLTERALASRERVLGPDHPDVATSLNNLAMIRELQGRHEQSAALYKRALAISEKTLGPDHPELAPILNNLALNYHLFLKRDQQAEPLYKRALAVTEKALGPDHPNVAGALTSLATLYGDRGQHAQAEPLLKRALAIREALSPDDPNVASSLDNLAGLYRMQGQFAQAELLLKRALAISEKALGPDHRNVAHSLNRLAELYFAQGQHAQAEPLQKRSLQFLERTLGPDHPEVATSLNVLGGICQALGQHAEAELLFKRALAIREKALGSDHPDVANSLNSLGGFHLARGQYAEAEPPFERALAMREKALGPHHPEVANCLNNLAALYCDQGQDARAEPLMRRVAQILFGDTQAKGRQHPQLQGAFDRYGALLKRLGRGPEEVQADLGELAKGFQFSIVDAKSHAAATLDAEEVRAEHEAVLNLISSGRSDEAFERATRNANRAAATGYDALEGNAAFAMGRAAHESGKISIAIMAYSRAAEIAQRLGNKKAVGQIMINLGTAYLEASEGDRKANLSNAIACQNRALETCTEADRPMDYAKLQFNMGVAFVELGTQSGESFHSLAKSCFGDAARVFRNLGMATEAHNAEEALRQIET